VSNNRICLDHNGDLTQLKMCLRSVELALFKSRSVISVRSKELIMARRSRFHLLKNSQCMKKVSIKAHLNILMLATL